MTVLDPAALRRKEFPLGLRGFDPIEVDALLERIASAIETFGDTTGHVVPHPDLMPSALRAREFRMLWRGYDTDEVRSFLDAVATEGEELLAALETGVPPRSHAETHNGPLPFVVRRPTTNPVLPVADMAAAVTFYEAIGFEVSTWDDTYAWVTHCGWEWCHLRKVDDVEASGAGAYLHVDDADAWRAAMSESSLGAVELGDIADMPWGKREFAITDPWGNWLRFGQPLGD